MNTRGKIYAIDMDGVLCKGEAWLPEQCINAKPIYANIEMVNRISQYGFVVIWTARRDNLIPATLKWLRKHNVSFQAISNNKMASDYYVDDKVISLSDLDLVAEFGIDIWR